MRNKQFSAIVVAGIFIEGIVIATVTLALLMVMS